LPVLAASRRLVVLVRAAIRSGVGARLPALLVVTFLVSLLPVANVVPMRCSSRVCDREPTQALSVFYCAFEFSADGAKSRINITQPERAAGNARVGVDALGEVWSHALAWARPLARSPIAL